MRATRTRRGRTTPKRICRNATNPRRKRHSKLPEAMRQVSESDTTTETPRPHTKNPREQPYPPKCPSCTQKNSRECRSATPPGNSSADGFRTPVGVRPCAITSSCLRWSSWQPSEQRSWPMQPSGPSAQPSSCSLRPLHPPRRRSSSSNANDASWASPP